MIYIKWSKQRPSDGLKLTNTKYLLIINKLTINQLCNRLSNIRMACKISEHVGHIVKEPQSTENDFNSIKSCLQGTNGGCLGGSVG